MLVLIDSNILAFVANPSSSLNQESIDATVRLRQRGDVPCVVPQNLYEFWAVATRPTNARGLGMTTAQAQTELARLKTLFQMLPDSPAIYAEWEKLVVQHSVSGKNSHDARIAAAMIAHSVTHLLTFNGTDFKRFAGITVIEPKDV
ncbi:MAG: PIN domain-containing protein [Acidobacteriota bacterium]